LKLALYQVDAFADKCFEGNPAAVCPLEQWLPDELMQAIAAENNLSETAFFVYTEGEYHIRWFTPTAEVDLCGHATLASAFVIFQFIDQRLESIRFESRSGPLIVTRDQHGLQMDFPAQPPVACEAPEPLLQAFNTAPVACLKAEDYIVVLDNENQVIDARPDMVCLSGLDLRGVIITARSTQYDFVVRFFAPRFGINEDPVTGSAYTQLVPYWSKELDKKHLHARQQSARGGNVTCVDEGERVKLSGEAVLYMKGSIDI
jgi:PhzF family phenazine biosynthesis protein